jgi:tetraacyldisaccharide 4'-kinase
MNRAPDGGSRRPPLPAPLGTLLSPIYRAAIGGVNRRFDRGKGVVTFDRPVISVGNISVGGTGKTPMVGAIVRLLLESGRRPCIAMRGYASSNGESDEAAAYGREFPHVPIVAQANRTLGLIRLFALEHEEGSAHTDCILLDDGFQHRQIARDLDIVLIDASRDPFADRLLPAGWLREPVESLRRAGAVVITHAESVSAADLTALEQKLGSAEIKAAAVCRHVWKKLTVLESGAERELPVSWLGGKRVVSACAIGNPAPFLKMARNATGGSLSGELVLKDHDPIAPATINRLIAIAASSRAQAILATEKDWSKLTGVPMEKWPCPVARPRLHVEFDRGWDHLRTLILAAKPHEHE